MFDPFFLCLLALTLFYSVFFGYVIRSHNKKEAGNSSDALTKSA